MSTACSACPSRYLQHDPEMAGRPDRASAWSPRRGRRRSCGGGRSDRLDRDLPGRLDGLDDRPCPRARARRLAGSGDLPHDPAAARARRSLLPRCEVGAARAVRTDDRLQGIFRRREQIGERRPRSRPAERLSNDLPRRAAPVRRRPLRCSDRAADGGEPRRRGRRQHPHRTQRDARCERAGRWRRRLHRAPAAAPARGGHAVHAGGRARQRPDRPGGALAGAVRRAGAEPPDADPSPGACESDAYRASPRPFRRLYASARSRQEPRNADGRRRHRGEQPRNRPRCGPWRQPLRPRRVPLPGSSGRSARHAPHRGDRRRGR